MTHSYVDDLPNYRVAVIGDLMLDCYLSGSVMRISPEAPVPVMRVIEERAVPGDAANVAANLARLDLGVEIAGLTGQDAVRDELIACLRGVRDINCAGIIAMPDRRTTKKLRIIGEHQQIVRVDHEDTAACGHYEEQRFLHNALAAIDGADIVVLSDYGKGVCTDRVMYTIFKHAAASDKKVIVDPKRLDLSVYREATRMPCESDGEAMAAAQKAHELSGADILLTRSEKGMSFFPVRCQAIHMATVAQDVFDVSDAGDTVVAILATSIAAGLPIAEDMRLANHGAYTDGSVRRLKGPTRSSQNEQARAHVMGALKGVAAVILFDNDTPCELIEALQPDVLIKGADYTIDRVVCADIVQARNGMVVFADVSEGHSTSRLVAASSSG